MNKQQQVQTFYDVQKNQLGKSVFLFSIIFLFYTVFVALFFFPITLLLLTNSSIFHNGIPWIGLCFTSLGLSTIIAICHFYEALYHGADYLFYLLQASKPDPTDTYHKQYMNIIDEIKAATGIQNIRGFVTLSSAVNSLGMILANRSLSIFISEGMLDKCSRSEIQAAIAHEIAHMVRGDTYYIGLICSLSAFFENIRSTLEENIERNRKSQRHNLNPINGLFVFFYLLSLISTIIMKLLSTFISREREIQADAKAIEITRDPAALASAIYKASYFDSKLGTRNTPYKPLFLAASESTSANNNPSFIERMLSTHPPAMKRISLLCNMAHISTSEIVEKTHSQEQDHIYPEILASEDIPRLKIKEELEDFSLKKIWKIRDNHWQWQGPFLLEEIIYQPYFTSRILVENIQTGEIMSANEHEAIGTRLRGITIGNNKCPHCKIPLKSKQYKGIPIQYCERCLGHCTSRNAVRKILIRSKYSFSEKLHKKAQFFKINNKLNPHKDCQEKRIKKLMCPNCSGGMIQKFFNYQFFLQINECHSCTHIWFDADKLEILQILIEEELKRNDEIN